MLARISTAAANDALPVRAFSVQLVRKALAQRYPEMIPLLHKAWTQVVADDKLTFPFERLDVELLDRWVIAQANKSRAQLIRDILSIC
jgi:hypothetical protein